MAPLDLQAMEVRADDGVNCKVLQCRRRDRLCVRLQRLVPIRPPNIRCADTDEPTVAEVERAIRANSRGPRARIIFGAVMMLAAGLFQIGVGTAGLGSFFVVLGVVFLIVGSFFLLILGSFKTVRERTAARLCVPTTVSLGGERFSFQLPTDSGETRWELTTVVSSADCWTLAVASRVSLVIPKRVLNQIEQAEFGDFLAGRDPKLVKTV